MKNLWGGKIKVGAREYSVRCVQCEKSEAWHGYTKVDAAKAFRAGGWRTFKGLWHCKDCADWVVNRYFA